MDNINHIANNYDALVSICFPRIKQELTGHFNSRVSPIWNNYINDVTKTEEQKMGATGLLIWSFPQYYRDISTFFRKDEYNLISDRRTRMDHVKVTDQNPALSPQKQGCIREIINYIIKFILKHCGDYNIGRPLNQFGTDCYLTEQMDSSNTGCSRYFRWQDGHYGVDYSNMNDKYYITKGFVATSDTPFGTLHFGIKNNGTENQPEGHTYLFIYETNTTDLYCRMENFSMFPGEKEYLFIPSSTFKKHGHRSFTLDEFCQRTININQTEIDLGVADTHGLRNRFKRITRVNVIFLKAIGLSKKVLDRYTKNKTDRDIGYNLDDGVPEPRAPPLAPAALAPAALAPAALAPAASPDITADVKHLDIDNFLEVEKEKGVGVVEIIIPEIKKSYLNEISSKSPTGRAILKKANLPEAAVSELKDKSSPMYKLLSSRLSKVGGRKSSRKKNKRRNKTRKRKKSKRKKSKRKKSKRR